MDVGAQLDMESESSSTSVRPAATPAPGSASAAATPDDWPRLMRLLGKQAKKFHSLLPEVLAGQNAEAVHDVRVCTRRLQQLLLIAEIRGDRQKLKAMRRELHRIRAAVGEWRNCDVILDRVARRFKQAGNSERRDPWALLDGAISKRRRQEVRRAQQKLLRPELLSLRERLAALGDAPPQPGQPTLMEALRAAIGKAFGQWADAARAAAQSPADETIHGFRIQMKRLRYRLEMAREFGNGQAGEQITWLRSLQDRLGRWHDRREFCRGVARALSRRSVLMARPKSAVYLLREVQRNEQMAEREARDVMNEVMDSPARARFDAWIDAYIQENAAPAPSAPPAGSGDGPAI